ncbi:MAG: acylphosphatase [Candidatus Thiodiazotropha sp. (ex Notomyrtea botanica)]|nr:acylphosphatase [Candidatus Thiodiazotropha sp. (ex Notomyrtea botanica)]
MNENLKTRDVCVRCLVAGRVQGVFFRASARHQAQQLGLTGYAKNLMDGRVEVVACGEVEAVEELRGWLSKGPENAQVSGVACEFMDYQDFSQFSVA